MLTDAGKSSGKSGIEYVNKVLHILVKNCRRKNCNCIIRGWEKTTNK